MSFFRQNVSSFLTILLSVVTSLVVVAYASGSLQKQADTSTNALSGQEPRIRFMEQHGHEEHERRISALEGQKTDILGERINTLASAVGKLAEIVATDHDSVVKLKALLEQEKK